MKAVELTRPNRIISIHSGLRCNNPFLTAQNLAALQETGRCLNPATGRFTMSRFNVDFGGRGEQVAWLRVFTVNGRARRFYERAGWVETHRTTEQGFTRVFYEKSL